MSKHPHKVRRPRRGELVPVDRSKWSAASRRSFVTPEVYEDIVSPCRVCGAEVRFTAAEQQRWFEVEGRHVARRRVYCDAHLALLFRRRDARRELARADQALHEEASRAAWRRVALAIVALHRLAAEGSLERARVALKSARGEGSADPELDEALAYVRENLT